MSWMYKDLIFGCLPRPCIRKFVAAGGIALLICGPVTTFPSQAQDLRITLNDRERATTSATVQPGTSTTVNTNRSFSDLVIGDSSIADAVPLSNVSFYIQGKKTGFTNISIYDSNKKLLGVVDVRVERDSANIESAVRAVVPYADVRVHTLGDQVQLSGVVANAVDMKQALAAAQQFSNKPVLNALSISDVQQVSLEVRVLEAKRSVGRDLGVKLSGGNGNNTVFGSGTGLAVNPLDGGGVGTFLSDNTSGSNRILSGNAAFGTLVANVLGTAGVRVDLVIDALEQKGLVRRLAQPNITTVSGESASFHAGGEIPVPTNISDGDVSYTYHPYGVVLKFVPTVLEDQKINIRVMTQVSELDGTLEVNGFPAFTSRKAEAVMELRSGQSFAMAGLLQVVNQRDIEQLPWLGNLPILGALFRSTSYQKQETDLVIVVTPRLVRPAASNEQLFSPLDQTRPSNDPELFLLGLMEVDKDMLRQFRSGAGVVGPYGHRLDLEFEDTYVLRK